MIKIFKGDLLGSKADFIIHQTNCVGVMGAGIALQIANQFPQVQVEYLKYLRHCKKNKIDPLGTVQYVPSEIWAVGLVDTMKNETITECRSMQFQYIVNLFGQRDTGAGLQTDYVAIRKAFADIKEKAESINATIALPYKIGCGLGGGDWNEVYKIINEVFGDSQVDVEIWSLE